MHFSELLKKNKLSLSNTKLPLFGILFHMLVSKGIIDIT